ncbi:MAG: hypothetical protein Q9195_000688 [Heterodermia aff. obscurata]
MDPHIINVLLTSFPGLNLPPTLVIPTVASVHISDLIADIANRLPQIDTRLTLTTSSNRALQHSSSAPLSSLLSSHHDSILPLRLSVPLCGGKGGFGSQLRAAGGRMSSKKKKNVGDQNSSNRNLDGRRLRTVNEAKALAEYLALKPEMDKKEKEARRKRWEQVVELAEKKEEELRIGNKGRADGQWVEDKEEAGERAREAVKAAMASGVYRDNLSYAREVSGSLEEDSIEPTNKGGDGDRLSDDAVRRSTPLTSAPKAASTSLSRTYYGFDIDDEFMSDDSEEGQDASSDDEEKGNSTVV